MRGFKLCSCFNNQMTTQKLPIKSKKHAKIKLELVGALIDRNIVCDGMCKRSLAYHLSWIVFAVCQHLFGELDSILLDILILTIRHLAIFVKVCICCNGNEFGPFKTFEVSLV